MKLAELIVEISGNAGPLNRTLGQVKAGLMGFAHSGGAAIAGLAGAFSSLAGVMGAAGVGYSLYRLIETGADLESRMVGLAKATDLEGDALARMKAGLLGLSTSLKGIRLNDLIDIATNGAKMGVAVEDLLAYAEGVAKVASAIDDMPAGEVADQIGKLNGVFKLGVQGTLQFGSAIDKLADSGMSAASGILNVSQRISGTAMAAKITAQETVALSAALLDTGTMSEAAAGALNKLILELNDADSQKGFARTLGISAEEFAATVRDKPMKAIQDFLGVVKTLDAGSQIRALGSAGIKGGEQIAEIMKLAQQADSLRKYVGMANQEFLTLDQITKSYAASAGTTNARIAVMQNQLQILGDRVGSSLLPAVNVALGLIGDLGTGLGGIFADASASVASWGIDLGGVVEAAGATFRNLGLVIRRMQVQAGGAFMNIWEALGYGRKVVGSVASYLWESFAEAFGIIVQAAINAKDNLVSVFAEVWDYVRSMGKDPIEFKIKGVMDGVDLKGDGKFRMPEFGGFSPVDNQLAEIDEQMVGNEQARQDAKARAGAQAAMGQPAKGGGGAGVNVPDAGKKDAKAEPSDLASYAKKLQEGIFGKDKDKQLLDVNRQQLDVQKQQLAATKNAPAQPGFAV